MCLIGIAHLPEKLEALNYADSLELRPTIITDIGPEVTKSMLDPRLIPEEAIPIIGNLFHSIKLITQKVLPRLPISGNVRFEDPWDESTHQIKIETSTDEINLVSQYEKLEQSPIKIKNHGMFNYPLNNDNNNS